MRRLFGDAIRDVAERADALRQPLLVSRDYLRERYPETYESLCGKRRKRSGSPKRTS